MKLLVILSRVPYPLDKGDKLRAYHQLRQLSKTFDLKVVALDDAHVKDSSIAHLKKEFNIEVVKLNKLKTYFNLFLGLFGHKPYQVRYFYQRSAQRKVKQIVENFEPDHIYCQLIRAAEYVKNIHNIPKTIDYMDAFSKGMDRRVARASGLKRAFIKAEASRLLKYENLIFEYFENKTIISKQDRDLIYHPERNQIRIVPNGVDVAFFGPDFETESKYTLVFTGNMNYPPNVDGAEFLAQEILPLIRKEKADASLLIAGANPAASVLALESEYVHVSGWVDDIREAYAQGEVFIAPMRIGTGLQNKLLEAMAMKIPSVTTRLANNALGGVNGQSVLIGNTADELAQCVLRLLSEKEFAEKIANGGRELVEQKYSWEGSVKTLSGLISNHR